MKTSSLSIVLLYALPLLFVSCYDSEKEKRQVKPVESRTERHETRDSSAPPESENIRLSDGQKELSEAQALLEKAKSEKEELEQQLAAMQMELAKPAHMRQSKSSGLSLGDIIAQLEKYASLGEFKVHTERDSFKYRLGEYYLENGDVALGMDTLSDASKTHSYTIGEGLLKHYHLLQDGLETIHDFPYLYEVLRIAQKGPKSLPRDKYVQTLLDLGADIDAHDGSGDTALIYAAGHLDADIVKQLIDAGADVHAKNDKGKTALRCATEQGSADSVRLLLAAGANGAEKDEKMGSLLAVAMDNLDVEVAKLLLEAGADVTERWHDRTHLHRIIDHCNDKTHTQVLKLAQMLLEGGVDVNAVQSFHECTALHIAVRRPSGMGVVKLLLEAGADVHAKDKFGDTALDDYWEYAGGPFDWYIDDDMIKLLLNAGADVSTLSPSRDDSTGTALMKAVSVPSSKCSDEVVQLLIKSGVDIGKKNGHGRTALTYAIHQGRASVVKMLLEAGADVNAGTGGDIIALHEAAWDSNVAPEIMKMLLDAGAKVNAKNHSGESALDSLYENKWSYTGDGKEEIYKAKVKMLEEAGAKRFSKGRG